MILMLTNLAFAQESVALGSSGYGWGVGFIAGLPTGISVIHRPGGKTSVDFALAWDAYGDDRLHVHADYLFTMLSVDDPGIPNLTFPVTLGVGGWVGSEFHGYDLTMGVRVPVGVALVSKKVPIDVFLEVVPGMRLYPYSDFEVGAAMGARVFFN